MSNAKEKKNGLNISSRVLGCVEELKAIRRDLHAHPELGNQEHRTSAAVIGYLQDAGVQVRRVGDTGVLAEVKGSMPGATLMMRADMDALPISDGKSTAYRSGVAGTMHACGHDAHTAMALVTAKLVGRQGVTEGNVKFLFQPAEEGGGGAAKMIEGGVLDSPDVDSALAFHVWSAYPVGTVAVVDGPVMASVDGFEITISGRGTHGATPEDGVDPVVIAAQVICAAQTLVARRVSPHDKAVLSFTKVSGGQAFNVIPDEVTVAGTIRTFASHVRQLIKGELETLVTSIAAAMAGGAQIEYFEELGPTVNDSRLARIAREVASPIVGEDGLMAPPALMVGEDFSLIANRVPGVMVLLGCGNQTSAVYPHHHPKFDIDEGVMSLGVEMALGFISRVLGS